jgi:1-acyl-sn-glycerol-3-phosphate acyltransferase
MKLYHALTRVAAAHPDHVATVAHKDGFSKRFLLRRFFAHMNLIFVKRTEKVVSSASRGRVVGR